MSALICQEEDILRAVASDLRFVSSVDPADANSVSCSLTFASDGEDARSPRLKPGAADTVASPSCSSDKGFAVEVVTEKSEETVDSSFWNGSSTFWRFQQLGQMARDWARCARCRRRAEKQSSSAQCFEENICNEKEPGLKAVGSSAIPAVSSAHGAVANEAASLPDSNATTTASASVRCGTLDLPAASMWELGPDGCHLPKPAGDVLDITNCETWSIPSSTPSEWSHAHDKESHGALMEFIALHHQQLTHRSRSDVSDDESIVSAWSAGSCRRPPAPPKALIARGEVEFCEDGDARTPRWLQAPQPSKCPRFPHSDRFAAAHTDRNADFADRFADQEGSRVAPRQRMSLTRVPKLCGRLGPPALIVTL